MSKLIDTDRLTTKSMELVIIGYLIGAELTAFKGEMEEDLEIDQSNVVFDIALSRLEDRGAISILKVIVENQEEPMWLISLNL